MSRSTKKFLALSLILVLLISGLALPAAAAPNAAPPAPVTFSILDTNDFHGQLEASNADPNKISTPGMARTAHVIQKIRDANTLLGKETLLVDAGDEMQGSLLSNLGDGTPTGKGKPTIATFNAMNYAVATFGNHEFDWGLTNLMARLQEATYPYVTANIVPNPAMADCNTVSWPATPPAGYPLPYVIKSVGTAPNTVKVAFIGVTTTETPIITVATATAGLCFKDPADSILHYYNAMKADGADVIVVLSHLGYTDVIAIHRLRRQELSSQSPGRAARRQLFRPLTTAAASARPTSRSEPMAQLPSTGR
jgi:2',3'-cyclic-nucleotide 2'-phosphodiesterase (5'-nucleotidase family)